MAQYVTSATTPPKCSPESLSLSLESSDEEVSFFYYLMSGTFFYVSCLVPFFIIYPGYGSEREQSLHAV
jgi:hypothetical protein